MRRWLMTGSILAVAMISQAAWAQEQSIDGQATPSPAAPLSTGAANASAETIVVTGSRLAVKGYTAPTPVTVVGVDRITALASSNLGDALVKLPSFRNLTAPTTALASTGSGGNLGARYLDLRGLGANRTLVLVDGRRFVPSSILGAFDSNLIPALMVKRVEVVTGGASAAYGSDAVSGVVNILLDTDFEGYRATVQQGIAQRGDAHSILLSAAGGIHFAGNRGRFVIGGEFANDGKADDCYSRSWCAVEPQLFQNAGFKTNGQPANFIATHVRPSTMTATGIINSPNGLRGLQFNPDGSLSSTPYNYGATPDVQFMIGGGQPGTNFRLAVPYLRIPVRRFSALSNVEYDITDDLTAFATGSYGQTVVHNRGAAMYERALTAKAENPFLPEDLRAMMAAQNIDSITYGRLGDFVLGGKDIAPTNADAKSRTFRIASGLKGGIAGSWKWDFYYQYGQTDYRVDVHGVKNIANFNRAIDVVSGPDGPICRSTLTNPADGCQPLNLFGSGQFSQAAYAYAFGTPWQEQHLREHVAALNVTGTLADLWAGPLAVAAGIEYRKDSTSADADATGQAFGWQYGNGAQYAGSINTKEVYGEASLPLARDVRFARILELNGAIRHTDYSTSGQVTTWKAGVVYEPVEGVRFRGTRSRDIRAPSAQELLDPGRVTPGSVVDRNTNVGVIARLFTGGNPNLKPEVATTWTAGVVLSPGGSGALAPLRLSVDYYDINLAGEIATLSAQGIVDRCFQGVSELCALITRDSAGLIADVHAVRLNLNRLYTRGIDVEFDYRFDLGTDRTLGINVLGNYVSALTEVDSGGAVNRAGQTGQQYLGTVGVPRWTVDATATLKLGAFTATLENRYIPKGKYDAVLVGPEDQGYDPTSPTSIASNRVAGRLYTNLGLSLDINRDSPTTFQVFGAINNLANVSPPIAPGNTGTNPSLFDTIGRTFQVGIRVRH
jgi:outer membrane receptor protein involved in Fe transport